PRRFNGGSKTALCLQGKLNTGSVSQTRLRLASCVKQNIVAAGALTFICLSMQSLVGWSSIAWCEMDCCARGMQ
ncbi:hypothetical protein, partial [Paraburkholderia hospita]